MTFFERKKELFFISLVASLLTLSATIGVNKMLKTWRKNPPAWAFYFNHRITQKLRTKYPESEKKPLVVVITSYNNEKYAEKNIHSILEQFYDNYRVIYIDDSSSDRTFEIVKRCVDSHPKADKFELIRNEKRAGKFSNLLKAFHSCEDHEIILVVDGDDSLANPHVLEKINRYYQNPDVWLTYGSGINSPDFTKKSGKPFSDKAFLKRKIRDLRSFDLHVLRTFYAGLAKQIQLKDCFYEGKFLTSADDTAYMYAMVEMAPTHSLYIDEILYIINEENPLSDQHQDRSFQIKMHEYVKQKPKYEPLPSSFDPRCALAPQTSKPLEMVILSSDNPLFLGTSLESYQMSLKHLEKITVLFSASDQEYKEAYEKLAKRFPSVLFKESTIKEFSFSESKPYILLATDDFKLDESIDLKESLKEVLCTGAQIYFLGTGKSELETTPVYENLTAINQISLTKNRKFNSDSFIALIKRENLIKALDDESYGRKGIIETILTKVLTEEEVTLFNREPHASHLVIPEPSLASIKKNLLKKFQEETEEACQK